MVSILVPLFVISIISTVAMIALYTTVTRSPALETATVDPFAFPNRPLSSADTVVANGASLETARLPQLSDWQSVTVHHLGDATDLLDYLDNHGIQLKELVVLDNNNFAVRWK